jgi:hypothetical protein
MTDEVLIIRPRKVAAHGGDEVVYRRSIEFLEREVDATFAIMELQPVGRWRRLGNLLRFPPELARFAGPENDRRVSERLQAGGYANVLLFNEVTFPLLPVLTRHGLKPVLVAHNVQSVVASSDPSPIVRATAEIARRFERRYYDARGTTLVCISNTDIAGLKAAGVDRHDVYLAPPGVPPAKPLAEHATVQRELMLTGSYGWWRKRRDLKRLAAEKWDATLPIVATDADALAMLGDRAAPLPDSFDWSAALRFGLVSDRFQGGFKLKVLEYIANNCVVLSYCDMSPEFGGIPDADLFVRHIGSMVEADAIGRELAMDADQTVARFRIFKAAVMERFSWDRCLAPLADAVRASLGAPQSTSV